MPHDVRIFSFQGMPKGRFCSKSKRVEQRCVQPASITAVTRGSCFKEPLDLVELKGAQSIRPDGQRLHVIRRRLIRNRKTRHFRAVVKTIQYH